MNRRNILWSAVSALGAVFAASRAKAATEAAPSNKLKVVYHDDRAGDPRPRAEGVSPGAG